MIHWFQLGVGMLALWSTPQHSSPPQPALDAPHTPAFAAEEEWPLEFAPATASTGGLCVAVDFGRSPSASQVRVTLSGARPLSVTWLEIGCLREGALGTTARQLLSADEAGCVRVSLPGPLAGDLGLRFVAITPRGLTWRTPAVALYNGGLLAGPNFQRGNVVITEIMKDPSFVTDAHGEWFEIQNVSPNIVNIAGWSISDLGSNFHSIRNGLQAIILLPGQRFTLGNDQDPATNGGVAIDYKYSNFTLGNGADSIVLIARRGDLVDEVHYDAGVLWPSAPGKSLSLTPSASDANANDDPANWCPASSLMGGGSSDRGTPLAANDICP